jgi:hypothetical protein
MKYSIENETFDGNKVLPKKSPMHMLLTKIVETNSEWLERKSSNLIRKISGNASMTQLTLENKDNFDKKIGLDLDPDMQPLYERPFLCVVKSYSWTWFPNAYPWPGLPQALHIVTGSFFVKLVAVSELIKMGMKSLAALDEFFPTVRDLKKSMDALPKNDVILNVGDAIYIAPGFIPLLTAVPSDGSAGEEEHSVAMVLQLFDVAKTKKVPACAFHQISSNIQGAIEQFKTSKTWSEAAQPLEKFFEKVKD